LYICNLSTVALYLLCLICIPVQCCYYY
jgi:hypothetical protein